MLCSLLFVRIFLHHSHANQFIGNRMHSMRDTHEQSHYGERTAFLKYMYTLAKGNDGSDRQLRRNRFIENYGRKKKKAEMYIRIIIMKWVKPVYVDVMLYFLYVCGDYIVCCVHHHRILNAAALPISFHIIYTMDGTMCVFQF